MEYSRAEIRTWSILGQRGTFGSVLLDLARENEKIIAMSADLRNTSGLDRFATAYPVRFLNVGIAEQNLIGTASGISHDGNIVFATTFANFAALRACEQIRHFLGYMKSNVKVVGLSAGFGMELFGTTHYGIEDIAVLRAIPNLTILSPADGVGVAKAVSAASEIFGPVYIRLSGVMNQPIIYKSGDDFKIGKANILRGGNDIAIIATGTLVHQSLLAANMLEEKGVSCQVIDMHTIKPLDENIIRNNINGKKLIVTVEEHSVIGGLGGAVSEFLSEQEEMPPLLRIGVNGDYPKAGDYAYLLHKCKLDAGGIVAQICAKLHL
jgi:transketolase